MRGRLWGALALLSLLWACGSGTEAADAVSAATAWSGLDSTVKGDTIVVVLETDGADLPLSD